MRMLFRRKLVMFGPRGVLLTSDQPVVKQFLNGRRIGPIGVSEEKDDAQMAEEHAMVEAGQNHGGVEEIHAATADSAHARAYRGGRPSSVTGPGCTRSCAPCQRARRKPSAPTRSRAHPSIAATDVA
jgi:hypothetical protein